MADEILVNSKFTQRIFHDSFPSIPIAPKVVYPGINLAKYTVSNVKSGDMGQLGLPESLLQRPFILSINRFEGKKNLPLALDTFHKLRSSGKSLTLVLAGTYVASNSQGSTE